MDSGVKTSVFMAAIHFKIRYVIYIVAFCLCMPFAGTINLMKWGDSGGSHVSITVKAEIPVPLRLCVVLYG